MERQNGIVMGVLALKKRAPGMEEEALKDIVAVDDDPAGQEYRAHFDAWLL